MPQVSVVIVCMNNLGNLYPCLDGIKKYTSVSYETFVVAYLFSEENKAKLRADYPWVIVVESDEIRGFSENNNLALRQATGDYCFVLNDDTLMHEPVVDRLVESFEHVPPQTAIVSPVLVGVDGRVQVCGRAPKDWKRFILSQLHLWSEKRKSRYTNGVGIFQTYNIIGAAFLIKTEVFRSIGWFDEYYFFCPEDIALSTQLNKIGYRCYVNADVNIVHLEGMSGKSLSMVQTATKPAALMGAAHFYSNGSRSLRFLLSLVVFITSGLRFIIHRVKGFLKPRPNYMYILSIGEFNTLLTIFSSKSPKEIFVNYYSKIYSK
ncbi:MAG: glycosyltransferase [Rikenellaceae bacterium]